MDKILKDKKAIFIFIAPALLMFVLVLVIPIFGLNKNAHNSPSAADDNTHGR